MKIITLKVVDTQGGKLSYRDQILSLLSVTMPNQPMDAVEMHRRLRILDVIEPVKDGDTVPLEDADHEKLKALVNQPIWSIFTREFLQFIDDVSSGQDS